MEYSSSRAAILQPFRTDYLPEPKPDEPLFLPADKQRRWYLGAMEHWPNFQEQAYSTWVNEECKSAFDEIKDYTVTSPRPADSTISGDIEGPALLTDHFRREVVEVVQEVYRELLGTMRKAGANAIPTEIRVNKGKPFNPSFVVSAQAESDNKGIRLIGHAEYLGGRPGALTWAVKEKAKNTWGSLRCVLGNSSAENGASREFLTLF
jgi:hypothetical protein